MTSTLRDGQPAFIIRDDSRSAVTQICHVRAVTIAAEANVTARMPEVALSWPDAHAAIDGASANGPRPSIEGDRKLDRAHERAQHRTFHRYHGM